MRLSIWVLVGIFVLGFLLRIYHVSTNPPGLYLDEASIGLNAYDLLTTGKDQYGIPHPLTFAAFGEYKMPVYIYLVTGAMYVFGKTEFAIRFPSVVFGSLTIGIIFLLFKEVLENEIKKYKIVILLSSLGAILLATSTWHLQFSRAGFEATVALFFYALSLLFLTYFWKEKKVLFVLLADVFLFLTFYTYDGYRLLVPLTLITSLLFFWKEKRKRKALVSVSVLFLFTLLPLILFTFTQNGLMRFSQTSAFAQYQFSTVWQQLLSDGVTFIKNYLSFFSLTFLFRFADQINRHHVENFGLLYLWQLPYVVLGCIALAKIKSKFVIFTTLFLLLTAPLAASLTVPSPHSLRFLMAIIPLTFLTIVGIWEVSQKLQKKKLLRTVVFVVTVLVAVIQFGYYLDYYYVHYPKTALLDWGGACKQLAQKVATEKNYSEIYIENNLCLSVYFSFYTPHVPVQFIDFKQISSLPKNQNILFIKPKNKEVPQGQLIDNIYLPNLNHDVFAQFWKL